MQQKVTISFKPSKKAFSEIESWLITEYKKTKQGFYCNWNIIKEYYDEKKIATISVNNSAIGFLAWYETDLVATIQICEIKPSERSKGYLKILFSEITSFFLKKNIIALSLECAPPSSEIVWRKLGFIDFPEMPKFGHYSYDENKKLYKLLVSNIYKNSKILEKTEVIELWNVEPHENINAEPIWKSQISFIDKSNKLANWIIFPCKPDWRIRWRKGDVILKDCKVKYFQTERIEYGIFLIIKALNKSI